MRKTLIWSDDGRNTWSDVSTRLIKAMLVYGCEHIYLHIVSTMPNLAVEFCMDGLLQEKSFNGYPLPVEDLELSCKLDTFMWRHIHSHIHNHLIPDPWPELYGHFWASDILIASRSRIRWVWMQLWQWLHISPHSKAHRTGVVKIGFLKNISRWSEKIIKTES